MIPDKVFSRKVPTLCLDSGIVSPLRLCWVKSVCVFRCNQPPALLAEWPGSFRCHCGNTWVERTPNKSQHTNLILEEKILLLVLPGFKLTTFRSQIWGCYQQAILAIKMTFTELIKWLPTLATQHFQVDGWIFEGDLRRRSSMRPVDRNGIKENTFTAVFFCFWSGMWKINVWKVQKH